MHMQTGPGPRQTMHSWLGWTASGEIISIAIFAWALWRLERRMPGFIGPFIIIGFSTLSMVLLEGSLYWLWKRAGVLRRLPPARRLRLLQTLYIVNGILLLLFPLALLSGLGGGVPPIATGDVLVGLGCYLFGLGEFIHYFVWKINMRGSERRRQRQSARRIPARFRRELIRAQRAVAQT